MNTLTTQTTFSVERIIAASPRATLIADRRGKVLCANRSVRRLFAMSHDMAGLDELFGNADDIRAALKTAFRSSGRVPAIFVTRTDQRAIHAMIETLQERPGCRGRHVIVTLDEVSDANRRMLALQERLADAHREERELRRENRELKRAATKNISKLRKLAYSDELTGLYNRRHFNRRFKKEWHRAARQRCAISLMLIDIDHFKKYNDHFGHQHGDQCLRSVAAAIRKAATREFDRVCRIGGEEFAILMPMTNLAGATHVARRVRDAVRELALPHPLSEDSIVTVSIGIGTRIPLSPDGENVFFADVDRTLYLAKENGRNRFERLPDVQGIRLVSPDWSDSPEEPRQEIA